MRSTRSTRRTSTSSVVSEDAISIVSARRWEGRLENALRDESGVDIDIRRATGADGGSASSGGGDSGVGERDECELLVRAGFGVSGDTGSAFQSESISSITPNASPHLPAPTSSFATRVISTTLSTSPIPLLTFPKFLTFASRLITSSPLFAPFSSTSFNSARSFDILSRHSSDSERKSCRFVRAAKKDVERTEISWTRCCSIVSA